MGLLAIKMLLSKKMRSRLVGHSNFDGVLTDIGGVGAIPSNVFATGGTGSPVDRIFRKQILFPT